MSVLLSVTMSVSCHYACR